MTQSTYQLDELNFETQIGGLGIEAEAKRIPVIDLHDFEARRDIIKKQLWEAATQVGFFQLKNHTIPQKKIEQAFAASQQLFELPETSKEKLALKKGKNAGWEFKAQVRPSTGTADQKESYQITLPHMENLWPEQALPDFKVQLLEFEYLSWKLGMDVLSCFAEMLGFETDFFTQRHERESEQYQSTLRLLHYLPLEATPQEDYWRAGAHTDFDCLTMVFQQPNQGGLQVASRNEASSQQTWSNVEPQAGIITCNIGDMLMRWSDDRLKSTLHRVRMPHPEENQGSRYSMAFFCQANKDQLIQGPEKKYPPITAQDYLDMRIAANFAK